MNHKRGKPKNSRAGCLMCKANKMNGGHKNKLGHKGFGKLKTVAHAKEDSK
jgi:hypothetical protein